MNVYMPQVLKTHSSADEVASPGMEKQVFNLTTLYNVFFCQGRATGCKSVGQAATNAIISTDVVVARVEKRMKILSSNIFLQDVTEGGFCTFTVSLRSWLQ